jgi:hypothetical protein
MLLKNGRSPLIIPTRGSDPLDGRTLCQRGEGGRGLLIGSFAGGGRSDRMGMLVVGRAGGRCPWMGLICEGSGCHWMHSFDRVHTVRGFTSTTRAFFIHPRGSHIVDWHSPNWAAHSFGPGLQLWGCIDSSPKAHTLKSSPPEYVRLAMGQSVRLRQSVRPPSATRSTTWL